MKRGSFSVLYTSQLTVRTPSPIQPTLSPEKSPHNRCHESSRPLNPPSAQADDIIIRTKSHVMLSIKIMSRLASTSRFSARFPGYNEPVELAPRAVEGGGLRFRTSVVFCATVGNDDHHDVPIGPKHTRRPACVEGEEGGQRGKQFSMNTGMQISWCISSEVTTLTC
jgi:hypothetical protein